MAEPLTAAETPVLDTDQTHLPQVTEPRNPGMPLDMNWVLRAQANTSAIERRAASLPARRSVKKAHQAAWLLRAVTCIDLTTLSGDDTAAGLRACAPRRASPWPPRCWTRLGMEPITTGAVCVYHEMIPAAVEALDGTSIPIAAVSTGFPAGLSPLSCASTRSR